MELSHTIGFEMPFQTHHQWNGLGPILNTPFVRPLIFGASPAGVFFFSDDGVSPAIFWKHPIFQKRSHDSQPSGESLRPISSEHLGKLRGLDGTVPTTGWGSNNPTTKRRVNAQVVDRAFAAFEEDLRGAPDYVP